MGGADSEEWNGRQGECPIDVAVLALFRLTLRDGNRASKGHDRACLVGCRTTIVTFASWPSRRRGYRDRAQSRGLDRLS